MFRRGGGARWREILQLLDETLKQRLSPPRSDLVALLDVVIGRVHVHLEAVRNHEVARVLMPLAVRRTECLVQDILIVAARWFAPPPYGKAFDTPLSPVGSLLPVGVCYRALRRLPGQDFHLQEQRVLQDAPSRHGIKTPKTLNLAVFSNSPWTG